MKEEMKNLLYILAGNTIYAWQLPCLFYQMD